MSLSNHESSKLSLAEPERRPYDLVVTDIDGTLVTSQNTIPTSVGPLIEQVQARGIGVTLATGRPRMTTTPILSELRLTLPYISSGGAFIFDPARQQILYCRALRAEQTALCVRQARAARAAIISQTPDALYYEGDQATWEALISLPNRVKSSSAAKRALLLRVPDVLLACPEPLKMTMCSDPGTVAHIERMLRRQAALHLTYSGPRYLEITSSEASKGEAVKRLASHLGIALERILAIGDSTHDLSMLEVVGTAVAMGNAPEEVKAAAHWVAPSNDEEGVAWMLRKLVLAA
jgi:Cof subfamily protein (haloacid dehalogenase superfamily)